MTADTPPDEPLVDKLYWKLRWIPSAAQSRVNRLLYRVGLGGAMLVMVNSRVDFSVYCSECGHELESSDYYFGPDECPACSTPFLTVVHTDSGGDA